MAGGASQCPQLDAAFTRRYSSQSDPVFAGGTHRPSRVEFRLTSAIGNQISVSTGVGLYAARLSDDVLARRALTARNCVKKFEMDCRAGNPSWPARPWPWNPSSPQAGVVLHTPVRQHSDQRGLDSKCIQSEQLQDHAANRLDDDAAELGPSSDRKFAQLQRKTADNLPRTFEKFPIFGRQRPDWFRVYSALRRFGAKSQCLRDKRPPLGISRAALSRGRVNAHATAA
jgi:hypothetical protein